jgi:hypothetical protein
MNPYRDIDDKKRTTKSIAAIPMAGAIVAAAILLSGLSIVGSFEQPVLAQQEGMTGTTTGGGGASDTNATTMGGGATTQGGNATTTGGAQGNDSMSQVRMHLEEARASLQNNDTQGALMQLDLALNALGGASSTGNMSGPVRNMTSNNTATAGGPTAGEGEGSGGGAAGGGGTTGSGQ